MEKVSEEKDDQILEKVKSIYYSCKLKECIQLINEIDSSHNFTFHQKLQLFKGMSYFKSQQIKDGIKCFKSIMEESRTRKQKLIEDVDVVISTLYQLQIQYYQIAQAEEQNEVFFSLIEDYRAQNEPLNSTQLGIYYFGRGMHLYIDTQRQMLDKKCFQFLEQAYSQVEEYKIEIMTSMGWIYYKDNQYEQACKCYKILYDQNPQFPSVANNYAISLEAHGDYQKAEELYLQEEQMRGYNQGIISNIAIFYYKRNNKEKEKEYYEKLLQLTPRTGKICHYYGDYLFRQGEKEKAIEFMEQGIQIDPDYFGNYEQLSDLATLDQKYTVANEHLKKCIELFPTDGYYQTLQGDCFENLEDFANAKKCYKNGLKMKNYLTFKIYSSSKVAQSYFQSDNYLKTLKQTFVTCNFPALKDFQIDGEIQFAGDLMSYIPLKDTIKLIEAQSGIVMTRYEKFANEIESKELKSLFLYKLDVLRNVISIKAYTKYVVDQLIFKSQMIHWDLCID